MVVKKFSVYIISFVVLFMAFQLVYGLILTSFYKPNFTSVAIPLNQEKSFGRASFSFLSTLLIATVAYCLSQKEFGRSKTHSN